MCVVSMVTDHYQEKWRFPIMPLTPDDSRLFPLVPNEKPYVPLEGIDMDSIMKKLGQVPTRMITEAEWLEYQSLKRKAEEYDARTNQPDCIKPELAEWENDMEAFLILMGLITEEDEDDINDNADYLLG
jgi:hypothetical protein